MAELKPCPFCGGEAQLKEVPIPVIRRESPLWEFWAECLQCGAGFPEVNDKQEAIEAWNRRAEPPKEDE